MVSRNPERDKPPLSDHLKLRQWVQDYPAWTISATCTRCSHAGSLHPGRLIGAHKQVRRFGDLKARLYCGECGSRFFTIKPQFLMRRE